MIKSGVAKALAILHKMCVPRGWVEGAKRWFSVFDVGP